MFLCADDHVDRLFVLFILDVRFSIRGELGILCNAVCCSLANIIKCIYLRDAARARLQIVSLIVCTFRSRKDRALASLPLVSALFCDYFFASFRFALLLLRSGFRKHHRFCSKHTIPVGQYVWTVCWSVGEASKHLKYA